MIARIWKARTTAANVDRYRDHFTTHVLPVVRAISGCTGAELLVTRDADECDIIVITHWVSLEAIRAFAGDDLERAVVADEVRALFVAWDRRVRHYDVLVQESSG